MSNSLFLRWKEGIKLWVKICQRASQIAAKFTPLSSRSTASTPGLVRTIKSPRGTTIAIAQLQRQSAAAQAWNSLSRRANDGPLPIDTEYGMGFLHPSRLLTLPSGESIQHEMMTDLEGNPLVAGPPELVADWLLRHGVLYGFPPFAQEAVEPAELEALAGSADVDTRPRDLVVLHYLAEAKAAYADGMMERAACWLSGAAEFDPSIRTRQPFTDIDQLLHSADGNYTNPEVAPPVTLPSLGGGIRTESPPKKTGWIAVLLVVSLICIYGIHLYRNYVGIQTALRYRASFTILPKIDSDSVSEIGYIFEVHRVNHIRSGRFTLIWFVAVPSTGERYACSYQAGFQGFEEGDGVTLIHKRDEIQDPDDYQGYIVGLHWEDRGKVAEVDAPISEPYDDLSEPY